MGVQQPRTLIAIGSDELERIEAKIDQLTRQLEQVQMTPRSAWVTIAEYAVQIGKSERTIRNWIKSGSIESRRVGTVLMVKR